jgi:hypothetical protein
LQAGGGVDGTGTLVSLPAAVAAAEVWPVESVCVVSRRRRMDAAEILLAMMFSAASALASVGEGSSWRARAGAAAIDL